MNKSLRKRLLVALSLSAATALPGCATIADDYRDPSDPLETFNRVMYRFNDDLDTAVMKPLARGYNAIMPAPVNRGVTNFFSNLGDVSSAVNNLLQLKLGRVVTDVGRVVVNSTVGVAGFMDVASNMDLPKYGEDFGQTLGTWGINPGPYLVLPVLGPSSVRDGVGLVAEWYLDPVNYIEDDTVRWTVKGLNIVDTRADLLDASRVLEAAALDPYAFVRDAYLQRRRSLVYDGNPPPETWPSVTP
jgi:phospholipid-binding lipoprotein MlaA